MKEEFVVIREEIEEIVNSSFLSALTRKIDEQILFINEIRDLVKTHLLSLEDLKRDELKFYKEIENYNAELLSMLVKKSPDKNVPDFKEEFSELIANYNEFLKMTDKKRIEEQEEDRFKFLKDDSYAIKAIKLFKSAGYLFTTSHRRILNLIRRLFHNPDKSLKRWKRKVYFRNLIQLIVRDKLLLKSFDLVKELNRDFSSSYQSAWMSEEKINSHFTSELHFPDTSRYIPSEEEVNLFEKGFDSVLKLLQKTRDSIKIKTGENLDDIFDEIDELYSKAGTLEYPSWRYSIKKVRKSEENVEEKYRQLSGGWSNTLYTLFEDWKLNKDIYINEALEVQHLYLLKEESRQKIIDKIVPGLDEIKRALFASKKRIEEQQNPERLREVLLREKSSLYKILSEQFIKDTAEMLLSVGIPETIDELEMNLRRNIEKTSVKRAIVKTEVYDREIRDSEIESIDPGELIRFEILPDFLRETHKLKASVVEQVDDIQKKLLNIDEIADFNLESAIASADTSGNNPRSIAVDGLQRAISKTDEIKSQLFDVNETINNSSSSSIGSFNRKILKLTKTDNVVEIRLRVAKAKAIEKTVQFRGRAVKSVKDFIPGIINFSKEIFLGTGELYKNVRRRFGLEKPKTRISAEISDFLTETENAINKLPYVYQRLFRTEPLEDEKFYEKREKEIDALRFAYIKWKNGSYAPAVLIGEKGSGITTTINFLLKDITIEEELIRTDADKTIECEEALLNYFGYILRTGFRDHMEIIRFLNSAGNKKIIIIENIQHLFIRKIGGFRAFKKLFEIISATNRNVFWIVSLNLYAWNYLERVLNISDYFSYTVRLNPFTDDQIVDIILKRHRVTGYNILFEPSAGDLQSKTFQRLSDTDKQKFLKSKYFSELNKFARSNLTISLFFWMRSTRKVKDDNITIGSLEDLDFSFLQGLSDEKVFTLYSLLIHDGLTVKQHAMVFNQSEEKSKLNLLLLSDDGIITGTKSGFIINPLLYRQIVSLLQTKNILH
ncbi:MAG TPA: hypothetical protein VKD08_07020 [Ignavibacteriaceae bacterium]|nr:hypothetical protein [Ignavibacteriaceae bacterium]